MLLRLTALTSLFLVAGLVHADVDKPILSLVIDDLGYSYTAARKVLDLAGDHSYAIIPGVPYSQQIAEYANKKNRELILHLPMQSSRTIRSEENGALHDKMPESLILQKMQVLLREIPNIKGINNHMGSHLTSLDFIMRPVMESIRQYNKSLYFLDSRTTAQSKAYEVALNAGLDTLERDIFLDNDQTEKAIATQFNAWLKKARNNGAAVAIAHPHPATIQFLEQNIAKVQDEFTFMSASKLIALKKNLEKPIQWPKYSSLSQKGLKNSKQ